MDFRRIGTLSHISTITHISNCYVSSYHKWDLRNCYIAHKYWLINAYMLYCRLVLKENAPIMMQRNLDPSNGLCNGTRFICRWFDKNAIHAEIITGEYAKEVFIPRIQISAPGNEGYPFKFIRKQFPIRLCFAMMINRAQGKTIPTIGLYLPQHVFSYG